MSITSGHRAPRDRQPPALFPVPLPCVASANDAALRADCVVLRAWLDCQTWDAAARYLRGNALSLLDPLTIAVLGSWIHANEARATAAGRQSGAYLRWHRRVLWRARRQGIAIAWDFERQDH